MEEKILEREESQSAGVGIEAERTDEFQELTEVEVADKVVICLGGHYENRISVRLRFRCIFRTQTLLLTGSLVSNGALTRR